MPSSATAVYRLSVRLCVSLGAERADAVGELTGCMYWYALVYVCV